MEEINRRINEINEKINEAEAAKKRKRGFVEDLIAQHESGHLNEETYKQLLDKGLDGRKLSEWMNYYDKTIDVYQKYLDFYSKKKPGFVVNKKFVLSAVILLLFGLLLMGMNFFGQEEISFAPAETVMYESCNSLGNWQNVPFGSWDLPGGAFSGTCASNPGFECLNGPCSFNLSETFDLSGFSTANLSLSYKLYKVDVGEGMVVHLDNGVDVPVILSSIFADSVDQSIPPGSTLGYAKFGKLQNQLSFTNQMTVTFECIIDNSGGGERCVVDEVTVIGDSPPDVDITSPESRIYNANEFPIPVTVSLDEGVGSVNFTLDNWATNFTMSTTDGINFNYDLDTLNTGDYTILFYTGDNSGLINNTESVDFSVDESGISTCAILNQAGKEYVLSSDVSGSEVCIQVNANDISLNGNGFVITGDGAPDSVGINLTRADVKNFTLKNTRVTNFGSSIEALGSTPRSRPNVTMYNSEVEDVLLYGNTGGGSGQGTGVHGGSLFLFNSNVTSNANLHGGSAATFEQSPGDGGNIYFENDFVDMKGVHISVKEGRGQITGADGDTGRISINYSKGFEDFGVHYGIKFALSLINSSYQGGSIEWNATDSLDPRFGNLDSNTEVSYNYAYVNIVPELGALNKEANITFRNMPGNFVDPAIRRDGLDCGNECTAFTNLNAETVKFNVTGFSYYYIGEAGAVNQPPTIQNIYVDPDQLIVEGDISNVLATITVSDPDGHGDITLVETSFFPPSDPLTRDDLDCAKGTIINPTTAEFDCVVGIQYYDEPGLWDVGARATDSLSQQNSKRDNNEFNLWESQYVNEPFSIVWSGLVPGGTDIPADDNLIILNLGNKDFTSITVTGNPLSNGINQIISDKFSVNADDLICNEFRLVDGNPVTIPNAVLPRGENSQEVLDYCAEEVPTGLSTGSYSGAWEILFALIIGWATMFGLPLSLKRRNELRDLAGNLSSDELLELLRDKLVSNKVRKMEIRIPLSIFRDNKLGPAEVLCKYLKENEGMKFSEIAETIGRDQRTVWNNYNNALKKKKGRLVVTEGMVIPVNVFNSGLSILEAIVYYLRKDMGNLEIAELIGKDNRNVWTLYSRAKKKVK